MSQVPQIAQRIRELREACELELSQVAAELGLSDAEYEKYESGEVDMPISLLLKISEYFSVDTTTILTGEAPKLSVCALTRKNRGVLIERHEQYIYKNLAYNFNHRKIEPLHVTVPKGVTPDLVPNSHYGHDFDYVLSGCMQLKVGDQIMILNEGDSAYYDSINPHAMTSGSDEECVFLAIVIP